MTLSPTAILTSWIWPATWATTGTIASAMISPLYVRLPVSSRRVSPLPDEAVLLLRLSDGVLTTTGEGVRGAGAVAAAPTDDASELLDCSAVEHPTTTVASISIKTIPLQRRLGELTLKRVM